MFKILRGKCQPTHDGIGFMKWMGKLILRVKAQILKVFGVECKGSDLLKTRLTRYKSRAVLNTKRLKD